VEKVSDFSNDRNKKKINQFESLTYPTTLHFTFFVRRIAGEIQEVGSKVTKFKVGDKVGVGCFVDSCFSCEQCSCSEQNYCRSVVQTYGSPYPKGKGHDECAGYHTNGGYSSQITVREDFVFQAPTHTDLKYVGPLLCAGITMFSPLNKHILKKGGGAGKKVGIVGFGGLGMMGVKLAKAMGAEVTVLSRSTAKKEQAAALGADILAHSDEEAIKAAAYTFDVILDTVAVSHECSKLFPTMKVGGTYVCIGAIPTPTTFSPMMLLFNKHSIEGSLVGGIEETQEMLNFCAEHNIAPDVKVIAAKDASAQFKALADGTAPAERAVIDMSTLADL